MQELSLNVLDIAQNSIKAKATLVEISIAKNTQLNTMSISIKDNGCGMSNEQVKKVTDPFFTTRTTRKVGLGVPFFKMSAENTGGVFKIESKIGIGTTVTADYFYNHIDMLPLGDMAATMVTLVSVNTDIDFTYSYYEDENGFVFDTREIKSVMGDIPINSSDVLKFIGDFISENQREVGQKNN